MLSKEELDKFTPWLISVAQLGSSVLPWIDNARDIDYAFYVTNNHLGKRTSALTKDRPRGECWFVDELGNQQSARLYAYEYHFLKPIYGDKFPVVDIFKDLPKYKEILINCGNCEFDPKSKHWYHVLTGIYLIQNGEYKLTEEQARDVRACHDKQMTLEIYNYIQEQLLEYKKELEEIAGVP